VDSPTCDGCGWTRAKAEKYKRGEFTKEDIEKEKLMVIAAERQGKNHLVYLLIEILLIFLGALLFDNK
jgi:hypothetical protein